MSPTTESSWISGHLYFDGDLFGDDADRILLQEMAPALEAWQEQGWLAHFFFIRYYAQGSHIRLRVRPRSDSAGQTLRTRMQDLVDGSAGFSQLQWQDYEPEVERYGGPNGLRISEQHFVAQSHTALALLKKIKRGDRAARLGKAMLAQLVLLHAFLPHRSESAGLAGVFGVNYLRRRAGNPEQQQSWIREFRQGFDRQSDHLVQYVEAAWSALADGDPLTPELDTWRHGLTTLRDDLLDLSHRRELYDGRGTTDWPACVQWLLPSYLHMLNNRLGVDLQEECYLAVLIQETLGSEGARAQPNQP